MVKASVCYCCAASDVCRMSTSSIRGVEEQVLNKVVQKKLFFGLKILKFFDVDPDPRSGIFLTRDPVWKNSDPG